MLPHILGQFLLPEIYSVARQHGMRDEFLFCLYEKILSHALAGNILLF
jgi:hypothetical protein